MNKLQTILVYSILVLFTMLTLRSWYVLYIEFISEESIANGMVTMIFSLISVLGWVFRKDIINDVIK